MKTSLAVVCAAAFCAATGLSFAQDVTPQTGAGNQATSMEGAVAFYNGQPYVILNGKAVLINAASIPNGQILTSNGLVPMPTMNVQRGPATPAQENTPPLNRSEIGTGGAIPPIPPAGGRSLPPREIPR